MNGEIHPKGPPSLGDLPRTFWVARDLSSSLDLPGYLGSPQDLFGVHIFFNNTQDFDKFTNIFPDLEYSKTHKFSNCMGSFLSENACDVMSKHPHKNTLWKTRNYYNDNNLDITFGIQNRCWPLILLFQTPTYTLLAPKKRIVNLIRG